VFGKVKSLLRLSYIGVKAVYAIGVRQQIAPAEVRQAAKIDHVTTTDNNIQIKARPSSQIIEETTNLTCSVK
jgi:hypothetical protein